MKIYIARANTVKNIKELLELGWSEGDDGGFNASTYRNKECSVLQCAGARNRSFSDLLYLCKTYFPETTAKDLVYELVEIHKQSGLSGFYCEDTDLMVFYKHNDLEDGFLYNCAFKEEIDEEIGYYYSAGEYYGDEIVALFDDYEKEMIEIEKIREENYKKQEE